MRGIARDELERETEFHFHDRDAELMLICQSGGRSMLAAEVLQRRGYRNLSVSRLVQLKALGIRPEEIGRSGSRRPVAMTSEGAPAIMSALLP